MTEAFAYVHELALGQLKIIGTLDPLGDADCVDLLDASLTRPLDEFVIDDSQRVDLGDFLKCVELTFTHTDGSRYVGTYTHNELYRMCPSHCTRSAISLTMSRVPMVFGYVEHMIVARFEDNTDDGPDETIDLRLLKQDDAIEKSANPAPAPESKQECQPEETHRVTWHNEILYDKCQIITMPEPIRVELASLGRDGVSDSLLGDQLARIENNIATLAKVQLLQYTHPDQPTLDSNGLGELLKIVKQSSEQFRALSSSDDIHLLLRSSSFLMATSSTGLKFSDLKQQSASDCILSRYISTHLMSEDPDAPECDNRPEIRALIAMGADVNHEHIHVSCHDYPDKECEVCGDILNYTDLMLHTSPFDVIMRIIKEAPFDQKLLDSLFEIKGMLLAAGA